MLKLLTFFLIIGMIFISCSDECDGENPSVQLVNNGTGKADIQIKTSGGNTENINNVETGSTSPRKEFAPGDITFTINIQGVEDPLIYDLKVFHCFDYTVIINGDNTVTGTEKARD